MIGWRQDLGVLDVWLLRGIPSLGDQQLSTYHFRRYIPERIMLCETSQLGEQAVGVDIVHPYLHVSNVVESQVVEVRTCSCHWLCDIRGA